jgi:hypothetical protein
MMELNLACLDDLVLGYLRSEGLAEVRPLLCMHVGGTTSPPLPDPRRAPRAARIDGTAIDPRR